MIIDVSVVNVFKSGLKVRDIKGEKRNEMLEDIGKRLGVIAVNTLHLTCPDIDQVQSMCALIDEHLDDFSPDEFARAVEYFIIGKLEAYGTLKPHFGRFTAEFLAPIMKAFRKYRAFHVMEYEKDETIQSARDKERSAPPKPMTPAEIKLKNGKSALEWFEGYCKEHDKLPMGGNWSDAYHYLKNCLNLVKISAEEGKAFEQRVFAVLQAEHIADLRAKSRRSNFDALPVNEYKPEQSLVWARMKKNFIQNYLIKKFSLNVQQEILFDSASQASGQVQSQNASDADHNSG